MKNDIVLKTAYDELIKKFNAIENIDVSDLVKKID